MNNKSVTRNPILAHVVSLSKDAKTAKVDVPRIVSDKKYGKRQHLKTTLLVDVKDALQLNAGDAVTISPCKKVSKRKAWTVVSLVTSNK